MLIIDAHSHIFPRWAGINNGAPTTSLDFGRIRNGNRIVQVMPPAFENSSCSAENVLANMNCHSVQKAVLFSNGGYGYWNETILKAVNDYPDRFCGLALVDLIKGEEAARNLQSFLDSGFLGMKYEGLTAFECSQQLKLYDDRIAPVWEVCNARDAIVVFHLAREGDIDELDKLKSRYPHIKMVIAHFGAETVFNYFEPNWGKLLKFAKKNDNVWLETSSLTNYADEQLFFERSIGLIEHAVRVLGSSKVIWGSDYPCMTYYATYYQMINLVVKGCKSLKNYEIEDIMGKNADKLFFVRDK